MKGIPLPARLVSSCTDVRNDGLTMKKEWVGKVSVPSNWDIKDNSLEVLPSDFMLERTHREIHGCGPCVVAGRISDALRELSIEAEYDNEKAKAKCRTSDFVTFRIRLYAGGESGSPVIVELQKRTGQSMLYMQSCRAILGAAEGNKIADQPKRMGPPSLMKRPISDMQCLKGVFAAADTEVDVTFALAKAIELLRSSKRDANLLGMENLCHLTDALKSSAKIASHAAKCVVIGDKQFNVRDEIEALIQRSAETPEFNEAQKEGGMDYSEQIHHHALRLFSSSLDLTAQAGLLQGAIEGQSWFVGYLIPTLIDEVKDAVIRPTNSYIAACCLNSLLCSTVALERVMALDGLAILETANKIGQRHHELLENETGRCIKSLQRGL